MEHPARKDLLEGAQHSEMLLRKPKWLTLTPQKLLTPDVLLEAEDAEEEILVDVEELGSCSPQSVSIVSLLARIDVLSK